MVGSLATGSAFDNQLGDDGVQVVECEYNDARRLVPGHHGSAIFVVLGPLERQRGGRWNVLHAVQVHSARLPKAMGVSRSSSGVAVVAGMLMLCRFHLELLPWILAQCQSHEHIHPHLRSRQKTETCGSWLDWKICAVAGSSELTRVRQPQYPQAQKHVV